MKVQFSFPVMATTFLMISGACSTSPSGVSGTGGNSGGGTGGGSSCPSATSDVTPCSGNVVGTWTVTPSCLDITGDLDVSILSLGCPTVPVTGSLEVTGTWTANADGTYTDNTTTTGSMAFTLSPACVTVSSTVVSCMKAASVLTVLGWATPTCSDASGQCKCSTTANQSGSMGTLTGDPSKSGTYTTSGGVITTSDDVNYSYCLSQNTLSITPQTPPTKGTIVLQKQGTTGSGGASGSGGTTGSGGAGASGGTTGSGGRAGSGGQPGSGGMSAAGGRTAAGGATGSGGQGGRSAAGGSTGTGGTVPTGGTTGSSGPCDIYAAASNTCVAAHSTVRALFGSYSGPLYQVRKADGTTKDISTLSPGGVADSSAQDSFCSGTTCVITKIYDQSGHGNFLEYEASDSSVGGMDKPASATGESLNVGGHKVYSLYLNKGNAYWRDGHTTGMPTGSSPQGIYMVTSGKHYNGGCCFDYGNGETSRTYVPGPSMDSVNFSSAGPWGSGAGAGPWVMADLEDGVFSGATTGNNPNNPTQTGTYVTALEKNNGTSEYQIKGADATTPTLGTYYKGALPAGKNPMKKQGAIVLGSGGDCCYSNTNGSQGTFYEGAIVAGYPSDATDSAVQANIVTAGYGK